MRECTVKISENGRNGYIIAVQGETLLDALRRSDIYVSAVCGGHGTCGKCGVKVNGSVHLACTTQVADNMVIEMSQERELRQFQILSAYDTQSFAICDRFNDVDLGEKCYGIAVDIGTTTIAFELVNLLTGQRAGVHTTVNRQRIYGADVVSRIQQANQGKLAQLNKSIIEDMRMGTTAVCASAGVKLEQITAMAVTGNTTMLHLLLNLPCDTLGAYPFTPVSLAMKDFSGTEIFGEGLLDCAVTVLPGVSTFVGADISAGMVFCGHSKEKPCLLIDLGTNGEMALFSKNKIICTSTAAGPAFEAGNISQGTGSVPGAIAKVKYENGAFICETIGGKPPIGLCGTGVVDVSAQLVAHELADETGLLADEYFDNGVEIFPGIFFTQKDIREIQLAKSAVRSGIEVLLANSSVAYDDIDRVYLAGGFGHKIDLESAEILGIIPAALRPKVTAVGNSALGGCVNVLTNRGAIAAVKDIACRAVEINLSADPRFNDLFMENMLFE